MAPAASIPRDEQATTVRYGRRSVGLTNLQKVYFPESGYTKGDLLRYYAGVAKLLVPHLTGRPMVMKRYPNGAAGDFFFMKRTPSHAPEWLKKCSVEHGSGSVIDFPIVDDAAALLWTINLGCIDLNPWYAQCSDVHRPDYLHFDLDPVKGSKPSDKTAFAVVREAALVVHDALNALGLPSFAKTSGSNGIHVYVPIVRELVQHEVWRVAKAFAFALAQRRPDIITAEYTIAKRPRGRVLVDYNQNAWGRTLASLYSVRPTPTATVSAPVTWEEIERGCEIAEFTIATMPARLKEVGDLWAPLLAKNGRATLLPLPDPE